MKSLEEIIKKKIKLIETNESKKQNTKKYVCYIIESLVTNRTYVGITNNLKRRLRQHQGDLTGGAKYTRVGRPWVLRAFVSGFKSHRQVLQFEWMLKHMPPKNMRGIYGRAIKLIGLVSRVKWTKQSPLANTVPLIIFCVGRKFFEIIEKHRRKLPAYISLEKVDDVENISNLLN